jgi:predicted kinase
MEGIILVGVQGSGKSTFYSRFFSNTHLRISLDLAQSRPRERRLLELCLERRTNFVIDNTNATVAVRRSYIEPALQAGCHLLCYYFVPDVLNAIRRNEGRSGKARIPKVGIYTTAKRMQPPSFEEGFLRIFQVELKEGRMEGEEEFIVKELRRS